MSLIQASISACEKGSQWIAAVQLLEDMVARRPGQIIYCWAVAWDSSEFGLGWIWDFCSFYQSHLAPCSHGHQLMFAWFFGRLLFVYVCLQFSECLFPTLKCFSTCTREGYKATSLFRAQLSVLVPNARSGNLRYGSSSRWRQQDVMVYANCENGLYDGRCCHQFLSVL